MKKLFLVMALMLTTLLFISACGDEDANDVLSENIITDYVIAYDFDSKEVVDKVSIDKTIFTKDNTLKELILDENYKNVFKTDGVEGDYGYLISSIFGFKVDSSSQYVAVFTTNKLQSDVEGEYTAPITAQGVTYYSANFGVSDLKIDSNTRYLFTVLGF